MRDDREIVGIELAPCPLCRGEVKLYDYTKQIYGFADYLIKCQCGLRFHSKSTRECYWVGETLHTPQTEESKKKAYDQMIRDWNNREVHSSDEE